MRPSPCLRLGALLPFALITLAAGPSFAADPPPAAAPAAADEPSGASDAANKIHELAKQAYFDGNKAQAIEYWREAHRMDPNWKYAYNLSNTLFEVGNLVDSWDFINESERLGIPNRFLDKLGEQRTKIQLDLLKTHAFIKLNVQPNTATVTLDGGPFRAPFERWVAQPTSLVSVRRDGYLSDEQVLSHAIGQRHEFDIVLERAPAVLVVTGTPEGAKVRVDGKVVGQLPEATGIALKQGRHDIHASLKGFRAEIKQIDVKGGQKAHVTFELAPVETGITLDTVGWITAGTGAATLIAATGVLIAADGLAADLNARNQDPLALAGSMGYAEYVRQFNADKDEYESLQTTGYILLGVGAAAVATGVAFILWPEDDEEEPFDSTVPADDPASASLTSLGVAPTPGGAAVFGGIQF